MGLPNSGYLPAYNDLGHISIIYYYTESVATFDATFVLSEGLRVAQRSVKTVGIPAVGHNRSVQASYYIIAGDILPGVHEIAIAARPPCR